MRDMKMRHKKKCRAGKCRNGKCGTKLQGWKMRDKSVWKANRRFFCNIKWIIVYWQNKNNHVIHIFNNWLKTYKALNICDPQICTILSPSLLLTMSILPQWKDRHTPTDCCTMKLQIGLTLVACRVSRCAIKQILRFNIRWWLKMVEWPDAVQRIDTVWQWNELRLPLGIVSHQCRHVLERRVDVGSEQQL